MRIIYIDSDYRCHVEDSGNLTAIETEFFDDKCDEFVEGYRFIPSGETWVRDDGKVFHGEMAAPFEPYEELEIAQREYEASLINTEEE